MTYDCHHCSQDPFINLLAGYLDKFSSKQKPVSEVFVYSAIL